MAGGLTIGSGGGSSMPPEEGAETAPDAGAGELAMEAVWKACKAGDYASAYEAFKDLLLAADDEIGPDAGDGGEPPLPPM